MRIGTNSRDTGAFRLAKFAAGPIFFFRVVGVEASGIVAAGLRAVEENKPIL
jgi:hypothetical protein